MPQLATLVEAPPDGDEWLHEIKYDGYRLLARIDPDGLRLLTRNALDWTRKFPALAEALRAGSGEPQWLFPRADGSLMDKDSLAGVFRRTLDPRVGAWELIRTALGYTLTLPLGIPLYEEPDYLPRAIDCLLHCLLKTDI